MLCQGSIPVLHPEEEDIQGSRPTEEARQGDKVMTIKRVRGMGSIKVVGDIVRSSRRSREEEGMDITLLGHRLCRGGERRAGDLDYCGLSGMGHDLP